MRSLPRRFVVVLVVSLLLNVSCSGASGTASRNAGPPPPSIVPATATEVLAAVQASAARVIVLNVWATWCLPCREEFPDLVRLHETYRDQGVELMLVSADVDDQIEAAGQFLEQHGVDFMTFIKTGDDMEFIDSLNPSWSGALPATFIYDANGRMKEFWEGKASYEQMEQRMLPVLDASTASNL